MKKQSLYLTIMTLVAAITLSSCSKQQDKSETEVPLKVTYTLDCSRDLLNLCDLVVTYKGDDGANAIDTITATPGDTTEVQTWTTVVETHQIPVKIGFDYNLVPKTDSLVISQPTATLHALCTIIAEKIGVRKRTPLPSEKVINSKYIFFTSHNMMDAKVRNTPRNLANFIKNHNDSLATSREVADDVSNTCFVVRKHPYGSGLLVQKARWNDNAK